MAEQLWKGRFSKAVDSRVNDFNSSIRFDQRMIAQDMRGSGVHAAMLAKQGIISEKDCEDILSGLASIADDLASGALTIDPNAEDVHTFVEQTLTARVGDAGKRLHTRRSRNDQVALDIRLNLREASLHLQGQIKELILTICDQAEKSSSYVMPGYTHLQRAQPVTFGHQLMAYAWMLLRDLGRMQDATARMDAECPLGSGALAGTTYPLDRRFTAEKLGFAAPCANSLDGVSDRDFCIELANAISICMMHLSRLSEEIILWCSWEFKFIELDDAYQMCTKSEMYEYLIKIARQPKRHVLTDVLLETLSIIAYKQPITKVEIEKIRGVSCDHAVNKLVEYNLVCELGRLDAPGRPLLFGTTEEFLRSFGVQSIDELPVLNPVQVEEFKQEAEAEMHMKLDI